MEIGTRGSNSDAQVKMLCEQVQGGCCLRQGTVQRVSAKEVLGRLIYPAYGK